MKLIKVRVSSGLIMFQTWDIGVAIGAMKKMFNASCEDFIVLMNDYAGFVCSDGLSMSKHYEIGEQGLVSIEFSRSS